MLYIERRKEILAMLVQSGSVKVTDLVDLFDVDATTIRRDLKELSKDHAINIVYGGAYYQREPTHGVVEINPIQKRTIHYEEKKIIAKKAAALVENGDTIIINNGVTGELILDYLNGLESINLITQSLSIATRASALPFVQLYLPGGKYRPLSGMLYGDLASKSIEQLSANKIFFGILCVSIQNGVTHPFVEEISVLQSLLEISQHKYLIADSSKFGKVSLGKVTQLNHFDAFIVDNNFPDIYREYAETNDIAII
ncbi:DeoR/GlpR family DNA-binding transcription regulator [Eubacterium aggregans]|uniref:DeoR/GlpR family DNA-binding transcription regulator n=2 Tax=Clostridia TaxID=186801 RepID=UPI0023F448B8|nr:DeoR/GlpR family DNA-binding transcription regulator [Eubacterium aggregans]MDD4692019.1 DeoR/GlpR family DNA-binding transcription regulator [Eubacterium aggregans]